MLEEIVCIDDLLPTLNHFKCPNYSVKLYLRTAIQDEFVEFLGGFGINSSYKEGDISFRMSKLIAIAIVIYQNRYRDELYRKEMANPVVTAMKFMDKGRNDRLYCRELISSSGKAVVICEIHSNKQNQKNKHKEISIIDKVAEYEFKIFS